MKEKVAILGASNNPERYANIAQRMLLQYNHTVFPVNPAFEEIEGLKVYKSLDDLKDIDTVTLYKNPQRLQEQVDRLVKLKPKRVIFNPGTESVEIEKTLEAAGIATTRACTLVLLRTNQFED